MADGRDGATNKAQQALHPVYTVTNIQHKIRVLDGTKVSYSSWVKLFLLHARGYDVSHHIDGTKPPASTDPTFESWNKIDAIVLQWIYGTLSDELLVRVLETESTAFEAWTRIKNIFLNNKGSRAAALEQEFNNMKLTDFSSLQAYFQKLKETADKLSDVDSPVSDTRLVLKLVRGLPQEYDPIGTVINQQLPSWEEACSMLQSDLQRRQAHDTHQPIAAAIISDQPSRDKFHDQQRRDQAQSQPRGNVHQRRSGQNTRRPNRGPTGSTQPPAHYSRSAQSNSGPNRSGYSSWPAQPNAYWPPYWVAPPPCPYPTQQGWATPWQPTTSPWQPQPTRSRPSSGSATQPQVNLSELNPLDPAQLGHTFEAMTMQPPDDQWYMDTGATNHLTSDSGLQDWEDPQPS